MNQFPPMRLAFIGIVLLSGVANLCVPFALNALDDSFSSPNFSTTNWNLVWLLVGILNGLLIGEFLAIAIWILWEKISLHRKLLLGFVAGFLLSACLVIGIQIWEGMPRSAAILLWVVGVLYPFAFAIWILVWSILIGRKQFQLQLIPREAGQAQYGIGFLLLSMLAVAVAIATIRISLPTDRHKWLSAFEFLSVAFWLLWIAIATSLLAWLAFAMILRPTRFNIGAVFLLTLFGPTVFQLVASFILVGKSRLNFKLFEPLAHSIALGVLTAGIILGLVYRQFGNLASQPSPDTDVLPPELQSPLPP